jgi:hypothetical protein
MQSNVAQSANAESPPTTAPNSRDKYLIAAQLLLRNAPECFGHAILSATPLIVRMSTMPMVQQKRHVRALVARQGMAHRARLHRPIALAPNAAQTLPGRIQKTHRPMAPLRLHRQTSLSAAQALVTLNFGASSDEDEEAPGALLEPIAIKRVASGAVDAGLPMC